MNNIFDNLILLHKEKLFKDFNINYLNLININFDLINFLDRKIIYIDNLNIFQNIPIYNFNDIIFYSIFYNIISNYNISKKEYKDDDYYKYINMIYNLLKNLPKSLFNIDNNDFYNYFYNCFNSLFEFKIEKKDNENIEDIYSDNRNIFVFYKYDKDFINIFLDIYDFIFNLDCLSYLTLNIPHNNLYNIYKLKAIISVIDFEKIYNTFTFDNFLKQFNKLLIN